MVFGGEAGTWRVDDDGRLWINAASWQCEGWIGLHELYLRCGRSDAEERLGLTMSFAEAEQKVLATMLLEYLDDPSLARPVLLPYGDEPRVVALLHRALDAVVRGEDVQTDALPGIVGVAGCSLVLRAGDADRGIQPIDGKAGEAFECVLRPETWTTVAGLLEPFTTPRGDRGQSHPHADPGHIHQYLTEAGAIEWIISTDRSW